MHPVACTGATAHAGAAEGRQLALPSVGGGGPEGVRGSRAPPPRCALAVALWSSRARRARRALVSVCEQLVFPELQRALQGRVALADALSALPVRPVLQNHDEVRMRCEVSRQRTTQKTVFNQHGMPSMTDALLLLVGRSCSKSKPVTSRTSARYCHPPVLSFLRRSLVSLDCRSLVSLDRRFLSFLSTAVRWACAGAPRGGAREAADGAQLLSTRGSERASAGARAMGAQLGRA